MKNKFVLTVAIVSLVFACAQPAYAVGAKAASASLLLPTTGQAMNNQLGTTKSKVMAGLEVGLITGTAILGGVVGGPVVWATVGPLIGNHIWSAVDAYQNAQNKDQAALQSEMAKAQETLEASRQRRYSREQQSRSDIRERVRLAGEMASQ